MATSGSNFLSPLNYCFLLCIFHFYPCPGIDPVVNISKKKKNYPFDPYKNKPTHLWPFCGNLILLSNGGEEYSINTVKYEYMIHLFFKFFGFILLLLSVPSLLFHFFLFNPLL